MLLRAAVRQQHAHRRPLASIPILIRTRLVAAAAFSTASPASLPTGHQANHNNNSGLPPQQPAPRSGHVDFSDTAAAYSSLKTLDLVRAYLVFRACGLRPLVTHADAVLRNVRMCACSCLDGGWLIDMCNLFPTQIWTPMHT